MDDQPNIFSSGPATKVVVGIAMFGFCCVGAWFLADAFSTGVMQTKGDDLVLDQEPFSFWLWATIQFVLLLFFGSFALALIRSAVRDWANKK